jgi:hypothetical protein
MNKEKMGTTFSVFQMLKVEACKLDILHSSHPMKSKSLSIEKPRSKRRKSRKKLRST